MRSPFRRPQNVPIQSVASKGAEGSIEVAREYVEGLKDLESFSHIILIYHCHLSSHYSLIVKPFLDEDLRGVFSTRAPARPNPIGVSVVRLIKVEDNVIHIQDLDIIDGTPLLEIKPYVPRFDNRRATRIGWLKDNIKNLSAVRDDNRFLDKKNSPHKIEHVYPEKAI